MEWQSNSTLQFNPLDASDTPKTHTGSSTEAHITLGLETVDALNAQNPAGSLAREKESIRQTIFRAAVDHIIPELARNTGQAIEPPPGQSHIDSTSDSHQEDRVQVRNSVLMTRHNLNMVFRLDSDRIMNPATLLHLGREGVASAITEHVIHSFEHHYAGKNQSAVASHSALADDHVTDYQTQDYTPEVPQISPASQSDDSRL